MLIVGPILLFLAYHLAVGFVHGSPLEQFDEELNIKTLDDGKVATHFSFKTLLRGATPRHPATLGLSDISQHYSIFPLALGQILREYAVTELHLTLNAGNWNYERWGTPQEAGAATGGELWAWMGVSEHASVDDRWKGLRNALSGLFCASLADSDEQRTTSPSSSFPPEGALPDWSVKHELRHATLPSERVCTENLTPFLKLLPCKSLSGIASLLNPYKIFDADWHGLGLHVTWHPDTGVQAQFSFLAVSNPMRLSEGKRDWSFSSIFDRRVDRACLIASSSRVVVNVPRDKPLTLVPDPSAKTTDHAVFELMSEMLPLDIELSWVDSQPMPHGSRPPQSSLYTQRSLRGSSQARGQLRTTIKHENLAETSVVFLETMPWFVQFYLHTLRMHCDGVLRDDLISDMTYTPPMAHSRPSTLQFVLKLPPNSTVDVTVEVTKAFLRYTEHPPDAQRGWDLPPAVLVPLPDDAASLSGDLHVPIGSQRVYTSTLLVDLATPDFSMPYNVIIFSCSLIAFIFGSVFNLLTRKFVVVQLEEDKLISGTTNRS